MIYPLIVSLAASNLAWPKRSSLQCRVKCVELLSSRLPSLRSSTTTTSISREYLSLETPTGLGRELPFVKQLPQKPELEASPNVFSDGR